MSATCWRWPEEPPAGDDSAIVIGQRNGKPFRKVIDIPGLYLGEKSDQDIILSGGDVIYVHRAPVFYIYGEAQRPGAYRIERGMTVMQAWPRAADTPCAAANGACAFTERIPTVWSRNFHLKWRIRCSPTTSFMCAKVFSR